MDGLTIYIFLQMRLERHSLEHSTSAAHPHRRSRNPACTFQGVSSMAVMSLSFSDPMSKKTEWTVGGQAAWICWRGELCGSSVPAMQLEADFILRTLITLIMYTLPYHTKLRH